MVCANFCAMRLSSYHQTTHSQSSQHLPADERSERLRAPDVHELRMPLGAVESPGVDQNSAPGVAVTAGVAVSAGVAASAAVAVSAEMAVTAGVALRSGLSGDSKQVVARPTVPPSSLRIRHRT
uniref:Uncharacterized protein n=1 Tax=Noctiluca scintillans TaxID=2966 RepID=A0A7S1FCT9_NOCSC|mmetsp:Transcript_53228/g.142404  ORF Transcript_53228/g.142404 Transcript_53228/m.142404 type:complete len:124 (+) Transcript_53228:358-729(+)